MLMTTRLLGNKLTVVVSSLLIFCLLLFSLLSLVIINFDAQYQAQKNLAAQHGHVQTLYQDHISTMLETLRQFSQFAEMKALINTTHPVASNNLSLRNLFISNALQQQILSLEIITRSQPKVIAHTATQPSHLSPALLALIKPAFAGETHTFLAPASSTATEPTLLYFVIPLQDQSGMVQGALLARETLVDLARVFSTSALPEIAICLSGTLVGSTSTALARLRGNTLCHTGPYATTIGSQHYVCNGSEARPTQQLAESTSVLIVLLKPLSLFSVSMLHTFLLLMGTALMTLACGVLLFALLSYKLVTRPLHYVQQQAQALLPSHTATEPYEKMDDLVLLSHTLHTLGNTYIDEQQTLLEQMRNLLVMSDTLMSTLKLEHLLEEFVSHMGNLLQVRHVSLHLYARSARTPWAVAQWSQFIEDAQTQPLSAQNKKCMVYIDPEKDITTTVTSKLAAMPRSPQTMSGHTRKILRISKLVPKSAPLSVHSPQKPSRIPPQALRELDLLLSQMAIQRQKIVYGEHIETIYEQGKERWASLAIAAGYQSVVAVPLLLQDQPIGAFVLYSDRDHHLKRKDIFVLSTAALQTSLAIENALLFAEVKKQNTALERANQLKSQFLATVTHELRTPLHSIISYGALLLEGFVDGTLTSEQEQHLQFMVARAEDLSHLVDDMLDLSKIEANRIEVKLEVLSLFPCLNAVVNQLKPLAQSKGLYLHLDIGQHVPEVFADPHRLTQVVLNLVSNALKFTEQGGVTIQCRSLSDKSMVHISVIDTGIGIAPSALMYIFEAFRQADGSTTRRFGGTGLGLTIAKKLIALQHGDFAVESFPGKGSTFSFTLPIA